MNESQGEKIIELLSEMLAREKSNNMLLCSIIFQMDYDSKKIDHDKNNEMVGRNEKEVSAAKEYYLNR